MMHNDISKGTISQENTLPVNQENASKPNPTEHQSVTPEGTHSPSKLSTPQDNPSRLGLLHSLTQSLKQDFGGHTQPTNNCLPQPNCATHLNTSNDSCKDPAPLKPSKSNHSSPGQNAASPTFPPQNDLPLHVPASQSPPQDSLMLAANQQSEHEQHIQKHQQQPQATQNTPLQCRPLSSPRPQTQNTQQNISPQHSVQKSPVHEASHSSTPLVQPAAPLPSHPRPAEHSKRGQSESAGKKATEGSAAAPQHTMKKSGPQNGGFKDGDLNTNHNQAQLVGCDPLLQGPRGPSPGHSPVMPAQSQGHLNGTGGSYRMGIPPHSHYNQNNMSRSMPPSVHYPYHNQPISSLHNPPQHLSYHQQGGAAYPYLMPGQQRPQSPSNLYPSHQYQQQQFYPQHHPQAQTHNQVHNRGGYPPEEWHRSHFPPHQSMASNVYPHLARGSSQSQGSMLTSVGPGPFSLPGLMSPGRRSEAGLHLSGPDEGKCESRSQVSTGGSSGGVSPAHTEGSERPESPKEILDLDSHNVAARQRGTQQPQQQHPPASAAHMLSGYMSNSRGMHPGIQQNTPPLPHVAGKVGNGSRYPRQPYPDPGRYAGQRPHPHLMEALHRPQQLPYTPGQTHMAMFQQPRPAGHFQGMMIQQSVLAPEQFPHSG